MFIPAETGGYRAFQPEVIANMPVGDILHHRDRMHALQQEERALRTAAYEEARQKATKR